MYIINTIPHGKCFVRHLRTRCFCIRNLTRSLRSLVRFLIHQQLVRKYRTQALAMKNSLYFTRRFEFPACAKLVRSTITCFSLGLIFYFKKNDLSSHINDPFERCLAHCNSKHNCTSQTRIRLHVAVKIY